VSRNQSDASRNLAGFIRGTADWISSWITIRFFGISVVHTTPPLPFEEIEAGCRIVAQLYPWIPSMILWRGWEYAAYRRFTLAEPVLDVGCGDGRFFQLVFPDCRDVVGVEMDAAVARAAMDSGVYRDVYRVAADTLPAGAERFGSAFANCSLEHMDNLPAVLRGIHDSLRDGGTFLCSVVTDRFIQWSPLSLVVAAAGAPGRAWEVQRQHESYHHLANPLPKAAWLSAFDAAGFDIEQEFSILPELTARLFLFIDQIWHLRRDDGECSEPLHQYLKGFPSFNEGFTRVLSGVLAMERDWHDGIGLVVLLRKR
jgi:SAM-dependent methyltransferase